MTFLVIANFKSNKTQSEVKDWLREVKSSPNMVVAPSFPHLSLFPSSISLAGQDVSPFPQGSYTGAINAMQLKELGVKYCIVGHSERRRYFHETSNDVALKVKELISHDLTPIICLEEKDVAPQFAALEDEYLNKCYYCFEPSSDIGGTTTADTDSIKKIKSMIDQYVQGAAFMYGGSVNKNNIEELIPLGLSGVLVSTASLDVSSFNAILAKLS